MKTAERPCYFKDPPDQTSESEEEYASRGYIRCDVPLSGEEPLRAGDIIRFIKYPTNESAIAQITKIVSFEESTEKRLRTLVLTDPYPVQYDDFIQRIVTLNYKTGELEDNRKWSHCNKLCHFRLVHQVICAETRKMIKWNRLGKKVEAESSNMRDIVDELHARAGDDLTRSFLSIVPCQPPLRLKDQTSIVDTVVYDNVEDICYKAYFSSDEESSNIDSNEELSMESGESSDESVKSKSKCVTYGNSKKSPAIQKSKKTASDSSGYSKKSDVSVSAERPSPSSSTESIVLTQNMPDDASLELNYYSSSEDERSDVANALVTLQGVKRKQPMMSWNDPVATFSTWKEALRSSNLIEPCDWEKNWQNNEAKMLSCATHNNCGRRMKIIKSSNGIGGEIFLAGSHSSVVSGAPYTGKGTKNYHLI